MRELTNEKEEAFTWWDIDARGGWRKVAAREGKLVGLDTFVSTIGDYDGARRAEVPSEDRFYVCCVLRVTHDTCVCVYMCMH